MRSSKSKLTVFVTREGIVRQFMSGASAAAIAAMLLGAAYAQPLTAVSSEAASSEEELKKPRTRLDEIIVEGKRLKSGLKAESESSASKSPQDILENRAGFAGGHFL